MIGKHERELSTVTDVYEFYSIGKEKTEHGRAGLKVADVQGRRAGRREGGRLAGRREGRRLADDIYLVLPRQDRWRGRPCHVTGQRPGRRHVTPSRRVTMHGAAQAFRRVMAIGTAKKVSFEKKN